MKIRNTSRYPDVEVRRLVEIGCHGINTDGVLFNIKNSLKSAYRGRTYGRVPTISPAYHMIEVERLITIKIGAPSRFPTDNMTSSIRWEKETFPWDERPQRDTAEWTSKTYYSQMRTSTGGYHSYPVKIRFGRIVRHPYGGIRSPLITLADWREALVALAAHEARHHQQMKLKRRLSEVDAERFSAKRLAAFREQEESESCA